MKDFVQRFRASGADPGDFPKFVRLADAVAKGLPLGDVLFGIRYAAGDIEDVLGEEWRRFTDGVDHQFSADLAEFVLTETTSLSDICFLHCQLGVSAGKMGRREETIEVYERLLAALGGDSQFERDWRAWTYNGIGWSNFILDRGDEAVAAAEKALEHDPSNNSWRHTLASGLYVAGRHDEAMAEFDTVMTNGFTCHAHPALAADPAFLALVEKHGAEFKHFNRGDVDG